MVLLLQLVDDLGVGVLDAWQRDAVERARVIGAHERLRGERAAHDLAVLVEHVVTERLAQLLLHDVPLEDLMPHRIQIDVRQALVHERLACGGLAGAHAADDEQLLHACVTSSITPPPKTVAPS